MTKEPHPARQIQDWACAACITGAPKAVLFCLASRYADWSTGANCRPSIDTLASDLGMGRSTVKRALATLLDSGWIEKTNSTRWHRDRTGSTPNTYRLRLERDPNEGMGSL